jgi:hypothetical protein
MENMLCPKQMGSLFIGPGGIIVSNFALINGPEISEYFMNSYSQNVPEEPGHTDRPDRPSPGPRPNPAPDKPVQDPPRPVDPDKPREDPQPFNPDKPVDPRPIDPDPSPGDPIVDPADEPLL